MAVNLNDKTEKNHESCTFLKLAELAWVSLQRSHIEPHFSPLPLKYSSVLHNVRGKRKCQTMQPVWLQPTHAKCEVSFHIYINANHEASCECAHTCSTFSAADGLQVESQFFHTHSADFIVPSLCSSAQAHRLNIRDLTVEGRVSSLSCFAFFSSHHRCTQPYLSSNQLEQGTVDRQQVDVCADGGLIEGAGLAVQLVQAGLTHCVRAAQTDGLVAAAVKLIVADGAGQELSPLGRLHRHPAA